MLISMFVSLFTSRVTLQVLGVTDFGIYNVVAGVVIMLGFFSSSLSNVTQRYLSFNLGKGDYEAAGKSFRQSFTILFLFALVVFILGETLGVWFVDTQLVIPSERKVAALWIFQLSLASVFVTLIQVPLIATIVSREKMSVYAYLGLFEAFAKLGIVYILLLTNWDKLVMYGFLMLSVIIISFSIYSAYCFRIFPEASFRFYWSQSLVKEMSRFIGYNLFGCFAYSGAEQGITIVLNLFFGPTINAARGISTQVVNVVSRFTENIMTAFTPQIVKSYGSKDINYMYFLIEKCSRFSFFLAAIIAFPIIANMHFLLQIWLGKVPDFTTSFTVLVLIEAIFGTLQAPLWIGATATGMIKNIQVYGRLITLSSLPLAYISLLFLPNPIVAIAWLVITQVLYWFYCIYDLRRQIGFDLRIYFNNVISPCLILSVVMSIFTYLSYYILENFSLIRMIVSIILMAHICLLTIYILLDVKEKDLLYSYIKKTLSKIYLTKKYINILEK